MNLNLEITIGVGFKMGYKKKYSEEEAREIGNNNLNRKGSTGKEINLEGTIHFKLKIIKKLKRIRRSTFTYECECECGRKVVAQYSNGYMKRKSCQACVVRPAYKPRALKENIDKFSTLRHRYKKGAIDRNYEFNLNREEFEKIIQEPCYYCGSHLQSKQMYNKREMVHYTGIDRVDNSIGYTVKNCVACCKECNTSKMGVSKNIIKKAYDFLFGEKDE